jgi:hypothetical protein
LVSHAGSALLAQVAEKTGLTGTLSLGLSGLKQRRSGHDQGRVIRDLAVMLADGGDCLGDLGALGDQEPLFGNVASASTAFRLIDRIACDPAGDSRPFPSRISLLDHCLRLRCKCENRLQISRRQILRTWRPA